MKENVINGLYELILERKETFSEGSYTSYLFEKGLDKILKKCGEECSEVIIAAKNYDSVKKSNQSDKNQIETSKSEIENEICDLFYHLMVLMVEQGIALEDIQSILEERRRKIGNLKVFHESNHSS